ncbi:hypothetical protein Dimus_009969, partial [Dionaea muscipula]
ELFPRLFSFAANKNASLADCVIDFEGQRRWELLFQVELRCRHSALLDSLLTLIGEAPVFNSGSDVIGWKGNPQGIFSVKSCYDWVMSSNIASIQGISAVWNTIAPFRIQMFGWLAWHGKVKTTTFLLKRGVNT